MCEECREALQNSHKNHFRVYWNPAWLVDLKSFRAQVKLPAHIGQLQICMFPCLVNP